MLTTTEDHSSALMPAEPAGAQVAPNAATVTTGKAKRKERAPRPSRQKHAFSQADLFRLETDGAGAKSQEAGVDPAAQAAGSSAADIIDAPLANDMSEAEPQVGMDDTIAEGDRGHVDDEPRATALIVFASGVWMPNADSPPPPNFADALAMVAAKGGRTERQLERLRSDIRVAARLTGCTPETLPTDPLLLRPMLAKVIPGAASIPASRWSSIRSTLRGIAVDVGAHAPRLRGAHCDHPAWQAVLDAAPDTPQRPALRRFSEWAVAEGLMPSMSPSRAAAARSSRRRPRGGSATRWRSIRATSMSPCGDGRPSPARPRCWPGRTGCSRR